MGFRHGLIEVETHLGMGDERRGMQVDIQLLLPHEPIHFIGAHVRDLLQERGQGQPWCLADDLYHQGLELRSHDTIEQIIFEKDEVLNISRMQFMRGAHAVG
jgi:hypothetical protein